VLHVAAGPDLDGGGPGAQPRARGCPLPPPQKKIIWKNIFLQENVMKNSGIFRANIV